MTDIETDVGQEDTADEPAAPSARSMFEYVRAFPVEDIRILTRSQDATYGDGRTVEALTAPFDVETQIMDGQGRYIETIGRTAFDRTLDLLRPQGRRSTWKVGVFYNHGMNIHGTPSDLGSRPIGTPLSIRTDPAGLITVTRYAATPLGDELLELINSGAITGHSFTGRVIRSDPEPGRLGYKPGPGGKLITVRRLELGLREYGPTPFPAYDTTAVMGVRSYQASLDTPDTDDSSSDIGTSSDEEPAPGDPPETGHSDRSDEDRAVRHAALATRIAREMHKRQIGL